MIKYYIVDRATGEKKKTTKEDFFTILIFNLDEAVKSGSYTTYEALCSLKFLMNQGAKRKKFSSIAEVKTNGFVYQVEANT